LDWGKLFDVVASKIEKGISLHARSVTVSNACARVFHTRERPAFSVLWRKRHQRLQEVRAYLTGGGDVSWECTVLKL
jgi:hypothetical protein